VAAGEQQAPVHGRVPRFDNPDLESTFGGCTALVILPTRNEEVGLARTLAAIPAALLQTEGAALRTVVIDGGSTDGTVEVARRAGVPVLHQLGRGKGGALLEAIEWARQRGIPHVIVLDADATYPPDQIASALALLRAGTDLVVGVRRPVWGPPRHLQELVHRTGNILLSWTASLLAHRAVLDVCSGFWGVSTERFSELGIGDSQFAIEAELVVKSLRGGLKVIQIPVAYSNRVGESKLRTWSDGGAIFLSILRFARSTGSPRVEASATPARFRDLLSIGVVTGMSGAVVICGPSELGRAEALASALRGGLPQATIHVETSSREVPGTAGYDPHQLFVHLAPDRSVESASSVTVSVHSDERRLRIHLPPRGTYLSGGRAGIPDIDPRGPDPSSSWRARFAVVTSRLNYNPVAQDRSMLFANGISVADPGRSIGVLSGGERGLP
jgi:Glycosyl transferase family 2